MRDTLAIELDGLLLHGTSHMGPAGRNIGILFLNSGTLPRSSRGDLYAHLADSLAERGFRCFRMDLPGLGDSQGEVPQEYIDFYKLVQEGRYAGCVAGLVRELRRKYGLAGIILSGICGGAQTSVFAAARAYDAGVVGLILLDMPFFLYQNSNSTVKRKAGNSLWSRALANVLFIKARMHDWVLRQRWEPYATTIYHRLKTILDRAKTEGLPLNTNFLLLKSLSNLLDPGIPTLVITAHLPTTGPPPFDYIGYVAQSAGAGLKHVEIHGTTHSFVENSGAEAVLETVSSWLVRFD